MTTTPDVTEPVTEPAVELAEELHLLVGALVRQGRAHSPGRNVTLSQISILKRLNQDGPHTVAELARLDKITHQSVTATVAALTERGLVHRVSDPTDQRRKHLHITATGRALLNERRKAGYSHLATMIQTRLSQVEQDHLGHTLPLLRRLLN